MQVQLALIGSRNLLMYVITDLNLDHIWAKRLDKHPPLSHEDAFNYLTDRLRLGNPSGTTKIRITVFGDTPREAADIANGIADRYKRMLDVAEEEVQNSEIPVLKNQIIQQEETVKMWREKVAENPQNINLQNKRNEQQQNLEALKALLKQKMAAPLEVHESRVTILSGAVPPHE